MRCAGKFCNVNQRTRDKKKHKTTETKASCNNSEQKIIRNRYAVQLNIMIYKEWPFLWRLYTSLHVTTTTLRRKEDVIHRKEANNNIKYEDVGLVFVSCLPN